MEDWMPKFRFQAPTAQYGERARQELGRGDYGQALGTAMRATAGNMSDAVGTFFTTFPKMAGSALGGVAEGVSTPLPAVAPTVKPAALPAGAFDAPLASGGFRQPGAQRKPGQSLTAKLPGAPKYSLEDFLKATNGMNVHQVGKIAELIPAAPKPPAAKERAGNSLYEMINADFAMGMAAATTDDEKRAVHERARSQFQTMFGADPIAQMMLQMGANPDER